MITKNWPRNLEGWSAWTVLITALSITPVLAQGPLLLKESFSREFCLHVGGVQSPQVRDVVSRELSVFVGSDSASPFRETLSREMSILVTTPSVPDRVTQLNVSVSPTGDTAALNWSGYNELAQRDVVRYRIYLFAHPFTNVSDVPLYSTVPAGTFSLTIPNLEPWQDHYFAVVAEDALGGFNKVVKCSAAYVLAPEALSRELSVFVGGEPASPYAQAFSRETSVLVTTPAVPDRISKLNVQVTPT